MKVGIVAGEKSGDYLGAELIQALKCRYPDAEFVGLCGPLMQSAGARTLAEMDKISIMGFVEVIPALRDILSIRKKLKNFFLEWQPDVFIGIDVPDFNLSLERKLKQAGIPTVHYVSPTVWAWRTGRIKKIRKSINLMLTLFPFEADFYRRHDTPVKYVGHPMAKTVLSWQVDSDLAQEYSNENSKLIALLPGSRMSEVARLAPIMLEGARQLSQLYPNLRFVIPAASKKIKRYIVEDLALIESPVEIIDGHSQDILSLCDLVVLASGTAALEAALFAKPMLVMYKVSKISELIARPMMVVKYFSMPNHLTDPPAVIELIQKAANADNMVNEVRKLLDDQQYYQTMKIALSEIAPRLNEDSGDLACDAIEALLASDLNNSTVEQNNRTEEL